MAKKQKKPNPQDATLRNVRAANGKIRRLAEMLKTAIGVVEVLELRVKNLEGTVKALLELAPTLQDAPKNQD